MKNPSNHSSINPDFNTAFILRLTWDSASKRWLILVKPTDGGKPHLFADLETAFLYIAGLYPGLV